MRGKVGSLQQSLLDLAPDDNDPPDAGPRPPGSLAPRTERLLRALARYNALERAADGLQLWQALLDSADYAGTYALNEVRYAQQLRRLTDARDARRSSWQALTRSQGELVATCGR